MSNGLKVSPSAEVLDRTHVLVTTIDGPLDDGLTKVEIKVFLDLILVLIEELNSLRVIAETRHSLISTVLADLFEFFLGEHAKDRVASVHVLKCSHV